MTDEAKLTLELWMLKAREAAVYYWAYEGLVDDAADNLKRCYEAGDQPDAAIKQIGRDLDLFEFGPAWGGW